MPACSCRLLPALAIAAGVFFGVSFLAGLASGDDAKPTAPDAKPAPAESADALGFKMKRIDGAEEDLNIYRGRVVLMVNVASRCGFTKQYAGLESLFQQKKADGLVVLGFPSNDFGAQEPGTDEEIKTFCESKFNVTFPMFSKISVKGASAHPLYKRLAAQPAPVGGEPKWNFTKFLVDRSGNVVARFDSSVKPDDPKLVARIDELLKAKP